MRANEFAELAAFVAVAEERSFRKAATRLNLRPSTLSHTVTALEERLGVRLLHRTTRTVAPTEAGAALLAQVAPVLGALGTAVDGMNAFRAMPQGRVRLNIPQTAATIVLAPRLGAFSATHPDVVLEVTVDDGFVDIVRDGFDAGIRLGGSVERDMMAVRVSHDLRAAVVASPSYWLGRPRPEHPRDLRDHRCIGRRYGPGRDLHRWQFARDGRDVRIAPPGALILDNEDLMRRAALDGAGVALLEEGSVADDVAAGRLLRVLEGWCPPISGFFLYHPSAKAVPPGLRALIDLLKVER